VLEQLVAHESPSGDRELLERCAGHLERLFAPLGSVRDLDGDGAREPHLLVEVAPEVATADAAQVAASSPLILCHYDTVWPRGTTRARPFLVDRDGIAHGPGVLDMKAGIVAVWLALRGLRELGIPLPRGARVSLTPDEEIGNPATRSRVQELAAEAAVVLVVEPPLPGGRIKTARGGHATVRIDVRGRAAHSGVDPAAGISAAVEAATLTLRAQELADPVTGTTVSVGRLSAGHAVNVIPAEGRLEIDVRAREPLELQRVLTALHALTPTHPDAGIEVTVVSRRPPMARGPGVDRLIARLHEHSASIGLELQEGFTGGVSEGNLAAAAGATVIDGLGPMGGGAHQLDEHVDVTSLLDRAAILGGLLAEPAGF
jgi:glutamate carboxypeptidase